MRRSAAQKSPPLRRVRKASVARKSHCANQSLAAELQRLRGMSMEERVLEALGMGMRYSWIEPVAHKR